MWIYGQTAWFLYTPQILFVGDTIIKVYKWQTDRQTWFFLYISTNICLWKYNNKKSHKSRKYWINWKSGYVVLIGFQEKEKIYCTDTVLKTDLLSGLQNVNAFKTYTKPNHQLTFHLTCTKISVMQLISQPYTFNCNLNAFKIKETL